MTAILDELVAQLSLEQIEVNLFRGQSQDLGWGTVYGGQVLGQALSAAVQTVPSDRQVHSLHAYFLRPGAVDKPIIYEVDRIRDGKSFTTRRVVAIQNGKAIFNFSASFQLGETGLSHQDPMPEVPTPEQLPAQHERLAAIARQYPEPLRQRMLAERPFELRIVGEPRNLLAPEPRPAHHQFWIKTNGELPDAPALHRYLLAYASDYDFLTTSLHPHGVSWLSPGMQVASLDHAMWFHEPFRVDEWLLHVVDSPRASGARGLVRGRLFTRDGKLVASTAQEGLIRQRRRA